MRVIQGERWDMERVPRELELLTQEAGAAGHARQVQLKLLEFSIETLVSLYGKGTSLGYF